MKNMKIEINAEQPIDDVVRELKRLGFRELAFTPNKNIKFIVTNKFGKFTDIGGFGGEYYTDNKSTTLAELKEMK